MAEIRLTDLEATIRDYDARIIEKAALLIDSQRQGARWEELDRIVGDIDQQMAGRHRALASYRRNGGRVANAHEYGAYVEVSEQ